MSYDPHDRLINPARASASPFRLLAGVVAFMIGSVYLSFLWWDFAVQWLAGPDSGSIFFGNSPGAALAVLFGFVFDLAVLGIVLRVLHKRSLLSLLGRLPLAIAQFITCAKALMLLYLVLSVVMTVGDDTISLNLSPLHWLVLLPVALPFLLIQIGTEELIFRGYLQSQLAARFRHPVIWIGLPSILFGLIHYDISLHPDNVWLIVIWAACFGVAAADLTARSGTLGPAFALHLVNNIFAILISAPRGDLDGLALFTYDDPGKTQAYDWPILPLSIATVLCGWLVARIALRR